jgi:hypothetical protein
MAIQEHIQKDNAARFELSRAANLEISKLAEAAANICQDDDRPIFHGIMARIQTLSEIVYYSQKLYGESEGDEPDIDSLNRSYKGLLS